MSAQVAWKPINISQQHGAIVGYKVSYRTTSNLTWIVLSCGKDCKSMVVEHLEPLTTYRFRVLALNDKGPGIASDAVELQMPALGRKLVL